MKSWLAVRGLSAVAVAACTVWVGLARGDEASPVVVDPRKAGVDYDYQGEYMGFISPGYRRRKMGVQIVARGGSEIASAEFPGGLPGSGWTRRDRKWMTGGRNGHFAKIAGQPGRLLVLPDEVWVYDARGVRRGVLKKVVRRSPTLGAVPPPGAVVLFDGTSTERLVHARVTGDGLLAEGAMTRDPVEDFFMHVEFRIPFKPEARGQARGNSGIYIQQRYEVQILDTFGLEGVENECGALYKTRRPDVNMCLPPLTWQTYDIEFRAARFDAQGNKIADARLTLRHNGVLIHNNVAIPHKTGAGRKEGPEPRPILLQNHHNPVRYRNLWLIHRSRSSGDDAQRSHPNLARKPRRATRRVLPPGTARPTQLDALLARK